MIPYVLKGLAVGVGLILLTIAIGFSIGLACADPDYYEDQVEGPEESDYAAERIIEFEEDSSVVATVELG